MLIGKLFQIAFRDLKRNRRRSILSIVSIALGLAVLMMLNGYIAGTLEGGIRNGVLLRTGHIQLRKEGYVEEKRSLLWKDLLDKAGERAATAGAAKGVKTATPVIWATGIVNTRQDTYSVQAVGIDPESEYYDTIRKGMVGGEFLAADSKGEVIIGRRFSEKLGVGVGGKINLTIGSGSDHPREGVFTVKGLFDSGVPAFDETTVYLTLWQAQDITDTRGYASAIIVMLNRQEDASTVAKALRSDGVQVLTWEEMNSLIISAFKAGMGFYYIFDGIVMVVVAIVITNTMLMVVFERIREIGILAALGLRKSQIRLLYMLEACILALMGILAGLVLGSLAVGYLVVFGIDIGDAATSVSNMPVLGAVMYGRFEPGTFALLSVATFLVVLLGSLYPASFAARMEPVAALHAQ